MISYSGAARLPVLIKFLAGVGLLLSLSGCNDDTSDLSSYMAEVKARVPAPIEPIPEMKPYVRFI